MKIEYKRYDVGFADLTYMIEKESGQTSFVMLPKGREGYYSSHREWLEIPELIRVGMDQKAWYVGNLCHLSLRHLPQSKGAGSTLKHGEATIRLRFKEQDVKDTDEILLITTTMEAEEGYGIKHRVYHSKKEAGIEVTTEFYNNTEETVELELLTSVSLDNLSPYIEEDNNGQMYLHRFYGGWSLEGKEKIESFEELNLERAWTGAFPEGERFGSIGSYPVQRYFPVAIVEDRKENVFWGIQLACPSSWQMEITRDSDYYSFSAGLADCEFGSFSKKVKHGDSFVTPKAFVSMSEKDKESVCHNLVSMHNKYIEKQPEEERKLPIIFNEWCATWGEPTHEKVISYARKLKDQPVKYIVIDAGWTDTKKNSFGQAGNGDWLYSKEKFPKGLRAVSRELKEMGFKLGIWFEFEVTTRGAKVFEKEYDGLHLTRNGQLIDTGSGRTFWDFRKEETIEYLYQKVILFLKENEISYLKVDYNASIGVGCDGAESPGEGLRQQMECVREFFVKIREEIPDIVIENCASGGHRLESSFMDITAMSSFSDAHTGIEIPCIAANLQALIPARQNQIWAVVEEELSEREICYRLCSPFLGRFCLSGNIHGLSNKKWEMVKKAMELYEQASSCIRDGIPQFYGRKNQNTRHPKGIQAVGRKNKEEDKLLLVVHSFEEAEEMVLIFDDIKADEWKVTEFFGLSSSLSHNEGRYQIRNMGDFEGCIYMLERKK